MDVEKEQGVVDEDLTASAVSTASTPLSTGMSTWNVDGANAYPQGILACPRSIHSCVHRMREEDSAGCARVIHKEEGLSTELSTEMSEMGSEKKLTSENPGWRRVTHNGGHLSTQFGYLST